MPALVLKAEIAKRATAAINLFIAGSRIIVGRQRVKPVKFRLREI
jgi:hypothetical protein